VLKGKRRRASLAAALHNLSGVQLAYASPHWIYGSPAVDGYKF
jgi:hypothetical protein